MSDAEPVEPPAPREPAVTVVPYPVPPQKRRWFSRREEKAPAPPVPPPAPRFAGADDRRAAGSGVMGSGTPQTSFSRGAPARSGEPGGRPGGRLNALPLTRSTPARLASGVGPVEVQWPEPPAPAPPVAPRAGTSPAPPAPPVLPTQPLPGPSQPSTGVVPPGPSTARPVGAPVPRPAPSAPPVGAQPVPSARRTTRTAPVSPDSASDAAPGTATGVWQPLPRRRAEDRLRDQGFPTAPGHQDVALRAVEALVTELSATRALLGQLLDSHRSETTLLREEVARLREEVQQRPVHPRVLSARELLQAHNDELADRASRLGVAASDAFARAADEVGLSPEGLDAVQAWVLGGGRGVVVDPDPQRRLTLGLAVLRHVSGTGRPVVVVAPRRADVAVWAEELRGAMPGTAVTTSTALHGSPDASGHVLVTTARAYARTVQARGDAGSAAPELLVAVDPERFATPSLQPALDSRSPWRLGLSGSYRRSDDGLVRITDPYFSGGVVDVARPALPGGPTG